MSDKDLVYVLRMFPQTSETFIANEILGLERLGFRIRVYSYRRPEEGVPHECVRCLSAEVKYLPDPLYRHPGKLLRSHWTSYRRQPARYRRTALYVLRRSVRNPDAWRRFVQAGYLACAVEEVGARQLHAHMAHRATQVTMLAGMLTGIPFSFSAHAKDIYTAEPADLAEKVRAAQFVVTCTGANARFLREVVEPDQRRKVVCSYHGVDVAKFSPGADGRADAEPVILSVGRLIPKKGFPSLIDACAALRERGLVFRCLVVGEGPERSSLERQVRARGLDDVVSLLGARSQEELLLLYRRAKVFALPCTIQPNGDRDGIPNVLLEAMATGLPVVSCAVSGIPELIRDGQNGLLVPERDPGSLASALERLLHDGELCRRLGASARETVVDGFDERLSARRLAELFTAAGETPRSGDETPVPVTAVGSRGR